MIIKFFIILSVILIISSCEKEFIELVPVSTVTIDKLYQTDKDYENAVVGAYSVLRSLGDYLWQFGDMTGDDTEQQFTTSRTLVSIDNFYIDINDGLLINSWRQFYNLISRCNMVLYKIKDANPSVIVNKERHIGEASFLRAWAYFNLINIFGDVPLIDIPISVEESYQKAREPVSKIYEDIIIPDLIKAENSLPVTYTGNNVGRATKGAAKSLLGKVYLYKKDYVNAEIKLLEVTTLGYSLLDDFNDLWDYSDEHHSEYIFDIEYEEGMNLGSSFTNNFCPGYSNVLKHFGIAGTGGSNGSPSAEMFTIYEPNDLRAEISRASGFTDENGDYVSILHLHDMKTFCSKYFTPVQKFNDSKVNWKLIRYADVLLMLAEALNENDKTDIALTYLNQVRQRAGVDGYENLNKSEARDKIYFERRLELHMEGHRWFDLVRTGQALTVMASKGMQPHHVVFPIPFSQVQLINNPDVLWQNPGYN